MRELLTDYGPIDFMWSDHWNATDENGVWRAVTDLAAELQPNLVFMGPDTWVPGNETGNVVYPMWNALDLYYRTVGLGANTIINLPIDTRGWVPDDIADAAMALGDSIRERFANPITETNQVQSSDTVELAWQEPTEINAIVTMENIASGQKVAAYTLEAFVDDRWVELQHRNRLVAAPPYNGEPDCKTIGHKEIDCVNPVVTNRIRFRVLKSVVLRFTAAPQFFANLMRLFRISTESRRPLMKLTGE